MNQSWLFFREIAVHNVQVLTWLFSIYYQWTISQYLLLRIAYAYLFT